jgi:hypothetical protein
MLALGTGFAMVEMRVVLREILRRTELSTTVAGERPRRKHVILVPHRGARISVRAIKDLPGCGQSDGASGQVLLLSRRPADRYLQTAIVPLCKLLEIALINTLIIGVGCTTPGSGRTHRHRAAARRPASGAFRLSNS